jgi:hypothetical protein
MRLIWICVEADTVCRRFLLSNRKTVPLVSWIERSVITGSTTAVQQTPQKKVFLTVRSFVAIVKISRCLLLFMINDMLLQTHRSLCCLSVVELSVSWLVSHSHLNYKCGSSEFVLKQIRFVAGFCCLIGKQFHWCQSQPSSSVQPTTKRNWVNLSDRVMLSFKEKNDIQNDKKICCNIIDYLSTDWSKIRLHMLLQTHRRLCCLSVVEQSVGWLVSHSHLSATDTTKESFSDHSFVCSNCKDK